MNLLEVISCSPRSNFDKKGKDTIPLDASSRVIPFDSLSSLKIVPSCWGQTFFFIILITLFWFNVNENIQNLLEYIISQKECGFNEVKMIFFFDFACLGPIFLRLKKGWHHASPFLNCLFTLVQVIDALLHVLVFQVFFIGGVNAVEGPVRRQLDDPVTGGVEDLVVVGSHEDGALELN